MVTNPTSVSLSEYNPEEIPSGKTIPCMYLNMKSTVDNFDKSFASNDIKTTVKLFHDIVLFFEDSTKTKLKIILSNQIQTSGYAVNPYSQLEYSIE